VQLLISDHTVRCPACNSLLIPVREWDVRVALMRHEGHTDCALYWKHYRVDRITGYAEEIDHAQEPPEVQVPSHGIASQGTIGEE
jgi:uncharacterized protein with PIN domain